MSYVIANLMKSQYKCLYIDPTKRANIESRSYYKESNEREG